MKGICFKECLFNKTVKGEKEQTRRIMVSPTGTFKISTYEDGSFAGAWQTNEEDRMFIPLLARYKRGEVIYLKEPYAVVDGKVVYKYNKGIDTPAYEGLTWKNKLFMPESVARYFIKITDHTAQKLQNISLEDCIKEGIFKHISHNKVYYMNGHDGLMYDTPVYAYAALIDQINGRGTWESNPWVWVYDYKLFKNKSLSMGI